MIEVKNPSLRIAIKTYRSTFDNKMPKNLHPIEDQKSAYNIENQKSI